MGLDDEVIIPLAPATALATLTFGGIMGYCNGQGIDLQNKHENYELIRNIGLAADFTLCGFLGGAAGLNFADHNGESTIRYTSTGVAKGVAAGGVLMSISYGIGYIIAKLF